MEDFFEWMKQNKEWLFGGLGVAAISFFIKNLFTKDSSKNSLKAFFNIKSNVTQINIENKGNEKQ